MRSDGEADGEADGYVVVKSLRAGAGRTKRMEKRTMERMETDAEANRSAGRVVVKSVGSGVVRGERKRFR